MPTSRRLPFEIARLRCSLFGVQSVLKVENAEALSFSDGAFDHVNCQGVVHHTPDTERAINEIARVIRPGGTASISVYYRNAALRHWRHLSPFSQLAAALGARLTGRGRDDIFRLADPDEIVRHYDGAENPIGRAYSERDFRMIVERHFGVESVYFHFFPARSLPFRLPRALLSGSRSPDALHDVFQSPAQCRAVIKSWLNGIPAINSGVATASSHRERRLHVGTHVFYLAIGHRLPFSISTVLFGDRKRFGPLPVLDDPSWKEWLARDLDFYLANQRSSVGLTVNRAGYAIVEKVDLEGKNVLEIGPGAIEHIRHWKGRPRYWVNYDIRPNLLEIAAKRIESTGVAHREVIADSGSKTLPFESDLFDVVFTFYALEHIFPLDNHLQEIARVLRPGGSLAGAIPCEGGLFWGLGRFFTSRRWLRKHTTIDPNRLICWEHPNFADFVLNRLTALFDRQTVNFWPLKIRLIDVNLIASFLYRKPYR